MKQIRRIAALAALLALGCAGPAAAQGVTTNDYSSTSTNADIRQSCKNMRVSTTGRLTGRCNPSSSDSTIDLTYYVECVEPGEEPSWLNARVSRTPDYLDNGEAKRVTTGSTGNAYYLIVDCEDEDSDAYGGEMELPLSLRLKNSSGALQYSLTDLW